MHLTDDCVVIAQEIGNERVRYLYGHVVVFDSFGNTKWMNLTDWAMTTAKESWPDKTCPKPEY